MPARSTCAKRALALQPPSSLASSLAAVMRSLSLPCSTSLHRLQPDARPLGKWTGKAFKIAADQFIFSTTYTLVFFLAIGMMQVRAGAVWDAMAAHPLPLLLQHPSHRRAYAVRLLCCCAPARLCSALRHASARSLASLPLSLHSFFAAIVTILQGGVAKYKAESKMHGIDEWSAEIHSKFGRHGHGHGHGEHGHSGSLSPSAAAAATAAIGGPGSPVNASDDRLGQAVGQGRVLLDDGTDSLVGGAPVAGGGGAGGLVAATPRASGGAAGAKQRALEKNLMALRSAQLSQEDSDEAIASIDRVLVSHHDDHDARMAIAILVIHSYPVARNAVHAVCFHACFLPPRSLICALCHACRRCCARRRART